MKKETLRLLEGLVERCLLAGDTTEQILDTAKGLFLSKTVPDENITEGEMEFEIRRFIEGFESICHKGDTLLGDDDNFDQHWLKNSKIDFKSEDSYLFSYIDYLKQSKFAQGSSTLINRIESNSKEIVASFGDPNKEGIWDRRGLLIGAVQSGKTANYTGVIHAATDVGYKIIFLISGTSNLLRRQTQERIEEMYSGRCTKTNTLPHMRTIGIGKEASKYKMKDAMPIHHTTCDSDFTSSNSTDSNDITKMSAPHFFVIKKNKSVLESLIKYVSQYQNIIDMPALIIDDEADLASINTNANDRSEDDKLECEPTTTNRLIRELLSCFKRKTFLAVTATPFANIFINPEAYGDEKLQDDLFPKDFIHALRNPSSYIGGKEIFGIDDEVIEEEQFPNHANNKKYIEIIDDIVPDLAYENTWKNGKCKCIPKKKDDVIESIPLSMKHAICTFLIAKTIRLLRNDLNRHASMMINVTVKTNLIEDVKDVVYDYIKQLESEISNYSSLSPSDAEKNSPVIRYLKKVFYDSYPNITETNSKPECQFSWNQIQSKLYDAVIQVEVKSTWSKSTDVIDYDENSGSVKTYIIVGGFTLSRGYTIPGLTVSYLYRTSTAMDTLYQMGRWFGYHQGYGDLIKIYMEQEVCTYYEYTVKATENLMDQIREMRRTNKTPKNFGLYVKKYSRSLNISSRKKLGKSEEYTVLNDQKGKAKSLTHFILDEKINANNLELTEKFIINNLKDYQLKNKNCYYFKNIKTEKVLEYLKEFVVEKTTDKQLRNEYIQKAYIDNENIKFDVLLHNIGDQQVKIGKFTTQTRNVTDKWTVSKKFIATSKSNILEPEIRYFFPDVDCESKKQFIELEKDFINQYEEEPISKIAHMRRERPLLVIGKFNFFIKETNTLLIEDVINYGIYFLSTGPDLYEVQVNNAQKTREAQGELYI